MDIKNKMREEIVGRINRLNPKLRIKVRIHDKVKYFKFGPEYPNKDISELMTWISEQYEKCKGMKDTELAMGFYFYLRPWEGTAYATVTMIKEFDGENNPIVEFESQLE